LPPSPGRPTRGVEVIIIHHGDDGRGGGRARTRALIIIQCCPLPSNPSSPHSPSYRIRIYITGPIHNGFNALPPPCRSYYHNYYHNRYYS